MKTLSDISEVALIDKIAKKFSSLTPSSSIGIGDDCSMTPLSTGEIELITTDLLIEDVHFIKEKIGGYALGHKTLAVNLSDIAAMGGKAISFYLSMAYPAHTTISFVDDFFEGLFDLSKKAGVSLLGGDTTSSPDKIVLNITVKGEVASHQVKKRTMAKPEQFICVTGPLGDSKAGLSLLLNEAKAFDPWRESLIKKHHFPTPKLDEGAFLAKYPCVGAMMDISDGLSLDLGRLAHASKRSCRIDIETIPQSLELCDFCAINNLDMAPFTLSGGEDYELLFTIDKKSFDEVAKAYKEKFSFPITVIGETLLKEEGHIDWYKKGMALSLENIPKGYDHYDNCKKL